MVAVFAAAHVRDDRMDTPFSAREIYSRARVLKFLTIRSSGDNDPRTGKSQRQGDLTPDTTAPSRDNDNSIGKRRLAIHRQNLDSSSSMERADFSPPTSATL
jgi:hypothetical protein